MTRPSLWRLVAPVAAAGTAVVLLTGWLARELGGERWPKVKH